MSKKFLSIIAFLLALLLDVHSQPFSNKVYNECDSVAKKVTVYYDSGRSRNINKSQYEKLDEFIDWAMINKLMPIHIIGWADRTGTAFQNARVSLYRARTVRNYLVKHGIESSRITYRGAGVDSLAVNNDDARRADVCGKVILELTKPQTNSDEKKIEANSDSKEQQASNVVSKEELPFQQDNFGAADEDSRRIRYVPNSQILESNRFYAGVGAGLTFAKSTLRSLAKYGNHAGYSISLLGGYRFDKIWAAELFMKYSRLKMYAGGCCSDYFIDGNGETYKTLIEGVDTYSYKNLKSDARVFVIGGRVNINLVPLWDPFSRWSILVMPFIDGAYNRANVIYNSTRLFTKTNYHFALGTDIGGEYQLNDFIALRLTTGLNFITGASIDGLKKRDHKTNYLWNSMLHVIFNY